MKNTTNNLIIGNELVQLMTMGKYIRHKWKVSEFNPNTLKWTSSYQFNIHKRKWVWSGNTNVPQLHTADQPTRAT